MKVIIVGAGEVGFHTAERLSSEGHQVTLLEENRDRLRDVEERLNVLGIEGSGANSHVLEEAGIRGCDLFIAVTDIDEVNVVACLLAREYSVTTKIARVKSMAYDAGSVLDAKKLGIELMINPVDAVTTDILNVAGHSAALEAAEFADGRIQFVGYPIDEDNPVCGLTLAELRDLGSVYPFVVTAITREGTTIIPRGDETIMARDHVFLLMGKKDLPSIRYLFGFEKHKVERVFVLGGEEIGLRVAAQFERQGLTVVIVDPDRDRCHKLADTLTSSTVLHTEITDVGTLVSEGLGEADLCIAATGNQETNILAALLAKKHGADRAICLVSRPAYVSLVPSLGLDACISPRLSTASAIIKYIRKGGVLSVQTLSENQSEVIEILMTEQSENLYTALKDLDFPKGAVVGALLRGDEAHIPTGNTSFAPGDRVVIFALTDSVVAVENFFGVLK